MIMHIRLLGTAIAAAAVAHGANAAGTLDFGGCPSRISAAQAIDMPVPEGWSSRGTKNRFHPFQGVSFYSGPPEDLVQLVPDKETKTSSEWNFAPSTKQYWVACEYGRTSVIVTRPLPEDVTRCTVIYDPDFSTPVAKSWSCRTGHP